MNLLQKNSWIRTVYLYLFALVGLALVVIGLVRLLDLGLKMTIFKQADKPESSRPAPPYPPIAFEPPRVKPVREGEETRLEPLMKAELADQEKRALEQWQQDYKRWQEEQSKIDYLRSRREREASNSLAFIMVGLPLYLYHWTVIKRDRREAHGNA